METQTKTSAKDVFLNLGAVVALYTIVGTLISLLFSVVNRAYPQVGAYYYGGDSISWQVATLIVFFPIFILLMWLLEKDYTLSPDKQTSGIHKWLAYITLFISGLVIACDLITVLYFFIDGKELTAGFLLKVLVLLVIGSGVFSYYLMDIRAKLTPHLRKVYRIAALVIVLGSIVWGFAVLGSPRTQRLYTYDQEKVNALMSMNSDVEYFFERTGKLPVSAEEVRAFNHMNDVWMDMQTNKPYEYVKTGDLTYDLCAEFNKASEVNTSKAYYGGYTWDHEAGHVCFHQTINPNLYAKPVR